MKKPVHKHRKHSAKFYNRLIIGAVALTAALIIALVVANALTPSGEYYVTADGHVHTADGTHVGDAAEMFGEGYTISEDGHVHDANGNHVATYDGSAADATEEAAAEAAE
ncbi:MAG: hypothetical protein IJA83_05115 [Clostridia bacterium]|nr:hypothetical protein [Clostridia bacterium]